MEEIKSVGEALGLMRKLFPKMEVIKQAGPGIEVRVGEDRYLIMHKREYYKSFKLHFPNVLKDNESSYGYAQIMTKELLEQAISSGVHWVVFVTPDARAYRCAAMLFKKFYDKYHTDVPHLPGEIAMPLDYFERVHGEEIDERDRQEQTKLGEGTENNKL